MASPARRRGALDPLARRQYSAYDGWYGSSPLTPAEAGALLRRRREALGLSQEQVASALKLRSANYLSYLETGKVNLARSKYLGPLAELLKFSAEEAWAVAPALRLSLPETPPMPGPCKRR